MNVPEIKPGDVILTICHGPCPFYGDGLIQHTVIRGAEGSRYYFECRGCGTVFSIPKLQFKGEIRA